MKETEKLENAQSQKEKIRERYKGIDTDQLDVIPALPQDSFYEDKREKRVAVYTRVSTDDPRQTSSYELQKNHYQDVVTRHPGWRLIEIYADERISGTSLQHRDAFIRMINDCHAGKIDLIVTKDNIFKEKLGMISLKELSRTSRERSAGSRGFAEAMLLIYNKKTQHPLQMTKLYSNKVPKPKSQMTDKDLAALQIPEVSMPSDPEQQMELFEQQTL
ncbi:MAG: recombinase family protein [Eubacterium sp.]|nr:recombinase family protein [Eubacterium sp.]